MNIGKITVSQLIVKVNVPFEKILDINIVQKENEQGMMHLVLEAADTMTLQTSATLQNTAVTVLLPDHRVLYSGYCESVMLQRQAGYHKLILEVCSSAYLLDREAHTETFQSPSKKMGDVFGAVLDKYSALYQLRNNPAIATVIYQQNETDWTFIRRIANQYGQQVYVNSRSRQMDVKIGTGLMQNYGESTLEKKVSSGKNLSELRQNQMNNNEAFGYQFYTEEYECSELTAIPGDQIGRNTVREAELVNEGGILVNHIKLGKTQDVRPTYKNASKRNIVSNIITGSVLAVNGTTIQVQFDADAGDMSGNCVDIPYESPISNSFYCMPDVGDKVFVYYENNGKIICMGSRRSSTNSPDFDKPEEKVLTSYDKMLRMEGKKVILTDTRKKHDDGDDTEISITLNDEDGITITSGENIVIESTEKNIYLATGIEESDVSKDIEGLSNGKDKFRTRVEEENARYVAEGGMNDAKKLRAVHGAQMDNFCDDLSKNMKDTFDSLTLKNLRTAIWGSGESQDGNKKNETEIQEADTYDTGVITFYGLNSVTFKVQESSIVIDSDIFLNGKVFQWLGYTKGEHEIKEEEYQDWIDMALDGLQLALDFAGMIPGIGTFFDIGNAVISLARGDFIGAGMSLLAAIPVVGDACTAAKMGVKAYKAAQKTQKVLTKVDKIKKTVKAIYKGLKILDSSCDAYSVINQMAADGFSFSNPNDLKKLIKLVSLARGAASDVKDISDSKKAIKTGKEETNHLASPNSDPDGPFPHYDNSAAAEESNGNSSTHGQNNEGSDNRRTNAHTTEDPIDVISGSLLAEYVDLSLEDVLEPFEIKRYYESIYNNRGGMIGDKWRFEFETSLTRQDDFITIQMPDLHMEKFHKEENRWNNLRREDESYLLIETVDGYLLKSRGSIMSYLYDTQGKLVSRTDEHGNTTQMTYEDGKMVKIEVTSGQWASFWYENGRVRQIEDNTGRTVRYEYQGNYISAVTLPTGGTMYYEYTSEGYITKITDLNGKCYARNFYDRKGRVIRQELTGGEEYVAFYDEANRQNTFLTTSDGNNIIYTYGNERLATKIQYNDGTYEEKKYDAGRHVIYERDRLGRVISRKYYESGLLAEEILPNGLITKYEYDENDRLVKTSDNIGRENSNEYDTQGNLICNRIRINDKEYEETRYTYDARGRILSMTDARGNTEYYHYDTLFSSETEYVTMTGDRIRYEYDAGGRLMTLEDAFGQTAYGYDNYGHKVLTRDPDGNITRIYYDPMANVTKVIKPNAYDNDTDDGIGTMYEYDAWDHLSRIITPEGGVYAYENDFRGNVRKALSPVESDQENARGIHYEYDLNGNRIRTYYQDGGILREKYDACNNLIKRILPENYNAQTDDGAGYTYQYDELNRLVKITNMEGAVEHKYVYDLAGNLIKDIDAKGYLQAENDEDRSGILYCYDLTGNVTQIRRPVNQTPDGQTRYSLNVYRYDLMGCCIEEKRYLEEQSEVSAEGRVNVIHYTYDQASRLISVTDSTGAHMEYAYDGRNLRTMERYKIAEGIYQERHYAYSAAGRLVKIMESADEKGCGRKYVPTQISYDGNGNITRIQTPSGNEILREYDQSNHLLSETHKEKGGSIRNRITFTYDLNGNLIQRTESNGFYTRYQYDLQGRQIMTEDADGAITWNDYDRNGNLVRQIMPVEYAAYGRDGAGYRFDYDKSGRNTAVISPDGSRLRLTEYNEYGEKVSEGDGRSRVQTIYDRAGRRIRVTTQEGSSQEYIYDAAGNVTGIVDGNGNRTQYETDQWGRITEILHADQSHEHYTYDLAGNITTAVDGNGNCVTYEYNMLNRLARRVDAMGAAEEFHYDREGQMCEHIDRDGRRELYRYNMYGAPTCHENREAGLTESWEYSPQGLLTSAIGGGMRYEYAYYANGSLKEKRASGRTLLSYTYDADGRRASQRDLTGKITQYQYTPGGQLSQIMENGRPLADYRYHEDGTVRSLTLGTGLYTEYAYDMDKNLSRMWTRLGEDTLLVDNTYSYDHNGNRIRKQTLDGLTRYAYDAGNRLVEVAYPGRNGITDTEYLRYDKAGNRTERIRGAVHEQYLYDECNRLLQITDGADTVKNYTYDNSGNMLSDGEMSYLYDGFGRLEQVTKADGSFQKNHYDAEGLRAEMEENGQLVKFLYNENREAAAEEESDGNVIRYIRGLGLISSDSEKAKTYYHYVSDEQGSITHVINGEEKESGELPQEDVQSRVLNHYEYDAFGNTIRCEEQVHNRFRYTGEQYDPLTGQYYLRARYYNPVIARFTQEDTYYGDGLNLYTYCRNNPILNHDPTGHGTKENSPYSRNEQQYIDVGADPDTARLAAQCYPDAKSKQDLYNKYKKQGYSAQDAKKLANREIIHGEEATKKYIKDNNVKKSGPDYTATSPRDNVNTDWRTQERLNAQRNAGAGKGNESGNKSGSKTIKNVEAPILPEGSSWERNVLNSFAGGKSNSVTYGGGTTLYRVGGKNGGFWSLDPPPATEYQWRVDTAIKQEFCNDASTLYKMTIPEGAKLSGLEGKVGSQGMGLYGGAHQVYIDYKAVPSDWIEIIPMQWK